MEKLTAEKEQNKQDAIEEHARLNGEIGEREDQLQQIHIQLEDAAGLAQLVKQQAAGQQLMRHRNNQLREMVVQAAEAAVSNTSALKRLSWLLVHLPLLSWLPLSRLLLYLTASLQLPLPLPMMCAKQPRPNKLTTAH